MKSITDLLRDVFPQRGTKIGPEDAECLKFVQWLREKTRANQLRCVWFHVPNEAKRSFRQGLLQRAKGLIPGVADYVFLYDSGALALEFKSSTGSQSKNQRDFERWCKREGIPYKLVRSYEEGIEWVESQTFLWGRDD